MIGINHIKLCFFLLFFKLVFVENKLSSSLVGQRAPIEA